MSALPLLDVQMADYAEELERILSGALLSALFQPIVDLHRGSIHGYEALIRGPSDSPLHSPYALFEAAHQQHRLYQLEWLAHEVILRQYAELDLPGMLFLNVSPKTVLNPETRTILQTLIDRYQLPAARITLEITESVPGLDYRKLNDAVTALSDIGFGIALDDVGEGFSSLRLWSELRPPVVKIDKHFVQHLHQDPVKQRFVRSIQEIAQNLGAKVVAEGIETPAELALVRSFGIAYGQGYVIARPSPTPIVHLPKQVSYQLLEPEQRHDSSAARQSFAARLAMMVEPVEAETTNVAVLDRFSASPSLQALPVIRDGTPIGLLRRDQFLEHFAKPFSHEIYGKKSCTKFMDKQPLIVDERLSVEELSRLVAYSNHQYLRDGFLITRAGKYLGMGSGYDLMRELTDRQLNAARYANPLTQLPGNVPINEQIDYRLQSRVPFVIAHIDLDHFKPFNDYHGYRLGDEVIASLGNLLSTQMNTQDDFVGHIGGDDFLVLLPPEHFEARMQTLLELFSVEVPHFFSEETLQAGGYWSENRRNEPEFHPLLTLSIGAALIEPECFATHHDVAAAANDAKKQAKKQSGNSLFIERRKRVVLNEIQRD